MEFDWLALLYQVFEVAIIPLLGLATFYFIQFIKVKKNQVISQTDNETAKKYIEMLNDTIINCVIATNQTYVDALKKAGSFDAEAQKEAFRLTYEAVMAILTDDAEKYLNESIKDLNAYITNKIESQVVLAKQAI